MIKNFKDWNIIHESENNNTIYIKLHVEIQKELSKN